MGLILRFFLGFFGVPSGILPRILALNSPGTVLLILSGIPVDLGIPPDMVSVIH